MEMIAGLLIGSVLVTILGVVYIDLVEYGEKKDIVRMKRNDDEEQDKSKKGIRSPARLLMPKGIGV